MGRDDRTGWCRNLERAIADNLPPGQVPYDCYKNDFYMALAYTVRDRLLHRWLNTIQTLDKRGQNCWLSVSRISDGPQLGNNLINLGSMTRCIRR